MHVIWIDDTESSRVASALTSIYLPVGTEHVHCSQLDGYAPSKQYCDYAYISNVAGGNHTSSCLSFFMVIFYMLSHFKKHKFCISNSFNLSNAEISAQYPVISPQIRHVVNYFKNYEAHKHWHLFINTEMAQVGETLASKR